MSKDTVALSVALLAGLTFLAMYLAAPADARPVLILGGAVFASVVSIAAIAGRRP